MGHISIAYETGNPWRLKIGNKEEGGGFIDFGFEVGGKVEDVHWESGEQSGLEMSMGHHQHIAGKSPGWMSSPGEQCFRNRPKMGRTWMRLRINQEIRREERKPEDNVISRAN